MFVNNTIKKKNQNQEDENSLKTLLDRIMTKYDSLESVELESSLENGQK